MKYKTQFIAVAAAALLALTSGVYAQEKKPDVPQPPPCGDQGKDNRPNVCSKLVGGVWDTRSSTCTPLGGNKFRYTHCNGSSTMEVSGKNLCCLKSQQCPSATYVGECMGK
jgi:hypothetical protein